MPLKGVSNLLQAVAKLRTERDVELQLVARLEPNGPTEKRIAELGISDIVQVSSGLSDAELAALLASAEISCIPSLYEGFSLPAVEAMSSGTPIVASRAGALPEVLEVHHVTGAHSLLIKVRTWNTATLEGLISQIRSIEGVQRTDTMVVFSTHLERSTLPLGLPEEGEPEESASAKKTARRAPAKKARKTARR